MFHETEFIYAQQEWKYSISFTTVFWESYGKNEQASEIDVLHMHLQLILNEAWTEVYLTAEINSSGSRVTESLLAYHTSNIYSVFSSLHVSLIPFNTLMCCSQNNTEKQK